MTIKYFDQVRFRNGEASPSDMLELSISNYEKELALFDAKMEACDSSVVYRTLELRRKPQVERLERTKAMRSSVAEQEAEWQRRNDEKDSEIEARDVEQAAQDAFRESDTYRKKRASGRYNF